METYQGQKYGGGKIKGSSVLGGETSGRQAQVDNPGQSGCPDLGKDIRSLENELQERYILIKNGDDTLRWGY